MGNPGAAKYGRYYWRIDLTSGEVVHANAEEVEIMPSGVLILRGGVDKDNPSILLAFASGEWKNVRAASVMDGHTVCVDHWEKPGQSDE